MYKRILILLLLLCGKTWACDICGCNNGGTFFGILPQSHRQFLGLSYRSSSFNSHLNSRVLQTKEHFQTTELWGRLYPLRKTQLLFFVPYHQNTQKRKTDGHQIKTDGMGDLSMLLHYNLINTFVDTLKIRELNHSLLLGLGIKAPTGQYLFDAYSASEVANANFQIGTGSWDIPLNAIYTIKKGSQGLNLNLLYKLNGRNRNAYKFANQSRLSIMYFRSVFAGNVNIIPAVGVFGEYRRQDIKKRVRNGFTGGAYAMASFGLDLYTGKWGLGWSGQLPLAQRQSGGELVVNSSFSLNLSRMF